MHKIVLASDTAEAMARVALKRATERFLEDSRQFQTVATAEIFGVGCTAALVSASPKKGSHRCNVAIISSLKGLSLYFTIYRDDHFKNYSKLFLMEIL